MKEIMKKQQRELHTRQYQNPGRTAVADVVQPNNESSTWTKYHIKEEINNADGWSFKMKPVV